MDKLSCILCLPFLYVFLEVSSAERICNTNGTITEVNGYYGFKTGRIEFILESAVEDYVIEIHFDEPIYRFVQWFGEVNSVDKKVFYLQPYSWNNKLQKGMFKFNYTLEYRRQSFIPTLYKAALCGKFDTPPKLGALPVKPRSPERNSQGVQNCSETTKMRWENGVRNVLKLPILQDTKGWVLEIKFSIKDYIFFDQWSCAEIVKDKEGIICENLDGNGLLEKGKTFDFPYILQLRNDIQPPYIKEVWFGNYHCQN